MASLVDLVRQNITELLGTFASPEAQRAYQRSVPFVNVVVELLTMWLDDLYHPTTKEFDLAFNEAERRAMQDFNDVVERVSQSIPTDGVLLQQVIASDSWVELITAARMTVARLDAKGT